MSNTPNTDSTLRELLSFVLMDGQNQIHDLKDGTATPEEITERMFKSLDYFTEKADKLIALKVQEARINEHTLVYDKVIDVEFNAFATWSDDRLAALHKIKGEIE